MEGSAVRETRSQVVFGFTHAYLHHTSVSMPTFAVEVVRRYHEAVPGQARAVQFHEGRDAYRDMRANAQLLWRFLHGEARLPVDLEEAWVESLGEPWREDCRAALAQRYGLLAAPLPVPGDGREVECVGAWIREFGEATQALAPMLEDGRIGPEDVALAKRALQEINDVLAQGTALQARIMAILPERAAPVFNRMAG